MGVFKHLDIEALPECWEAAHFRDLTAYALGRTPPRNDVSYWKDGTYPWVSISDMEPYGIVKDTAEKVTEKAFERVFRGQLVPEGSLLMSFKLTIGRIARLGIPALHNEAIISFVPEREKVDDRYLAYYLSQINYSDYQDKAIKGHTLNKGKIDALEIALPPLPEQQRIAQVLSTVQEAIAQQERLIRTTTELKQALMQKLFTEGLRGEALKETEIGRVPESWEVVKLEEFCQRPDGLIQTGPFGSQLHSHEYTSEGIPVVNPTHLSGNRINHEDVPRVPKEVADRLGRHYVQLGDILFARRGEIGRHGLVGKAEVGWLCGTGCFLVRANDPRLNNDYLSYFCSIKPVVDWLNSHAAGAIMPNLSTSVIANLPVGLPPLYEQRQIIEAFNALEQKLDQAEQKRTKLQDLFRTLLHELMTGKVRVGAN